MKKEILKNHNGLAVLQALMVTGFVGAISGILLSQMRLTENTLLVPKIRSEMLIAESAFRNFAYMNGTYVAPTSTSGASTVTITASANTWLAGFESRLMTACPAAATCEVLFQPDATSPTYVGGNKYDFDRPNRRLKTRIVYTGANIQVRPIDIDIQVPDHVLLGLPFRCAALPAGTGTPFFRGYEADGDPICTGWPAHQDSDGALCPPGEFMSAIHPRTMQITCLPLTANPNANCGGATNQYISNLNWGVASGGAMTFTCTNRPNPFDYYGYGP